MLSVGSKVLGSAQKGHNRLLLNFHSCHFCGCVLQHFKWQITHVFARVKHGRPCHVRTEKWNLRGGLLPNLCRESSCWLCPQHLLTCSRTGLSFLPPTVVLNTCDIFQGVVQVRLDFTREGAVACCWEKLNPALSCFLRRGLCQGNLIQGCGGRPCGGKPWTLTGVFTFFG